MGLVMMRMGLSLLMELELEMRQGTSTTVQITQIHLPNVSHHFLTPIYISDSIFSGFCGWGSLHGNICKLWIFYIASENLDG